MFPLSHQHGLTNNSNTGQKADMAVVFLSGSEGDLVLAF